jgi:trans-2-enoyl-CoA reductase
MTRATIEKIKDTPHGTALEKKKQWRKALLEAGREREARETQTSIAGYVQALRNCGVITERERSVLYIYYGTT